jgi:outer membrane protein assembly factor BamA
MPLDPATWKAVAPVSPKAGSTELVRHFGSQPGGLLVKKEPGAVEGLLILADSVPTTKSYVPTRFRRLANAINVYSWGPVVGSTGQDLTVGLNSQDLLSTTQLGVGYAYNQAERVGAYFANLSYQGLYPIIDLSFQRGDRNTSLYVDRRTPLDSLRSDRWQYNQLTAGFRLPLRLTQSKYAQSLSVSAYYNYLQVSGYDLPFRSITEVGPAGSLNALTYGFSYSRVLRQSKRDVGPRWGQTISASYRTTPFGGRLNGEQLGVQANVFFPGLGKHHTLWFRGGYQQQARGTYRFSPAVFYPRGQAYVSDDRIVAGSAEYRLPLADMHWSIGRLLYLQRIKAAGFLDGALGRSTVELRDAAGQPRGVTTRSRNYATTGFDVSFVFNVLRLRTPLEAGARTTYNFNTGTWDVDLLVIDIGF